MRYYNPYFDDETVERVLEYANYLVKEMCTVRDVAKHYKAPKTSVHKDLSDKLDKIDKDLYEEVQLVFELNNEERAHRGGMGTQKKYAEKRRQRTS